MKKINLIQFGIGNIGTELIRQINDSKDKIKNNLSIDLNYICFVEYNCFSFKEGGFSDDEINMILEFKKNKKNISEIMFFDDKPNDEEILNRIKKKIKNCILVDVTASNNMYNIFLSSLKNGLHVVTSNKKPFCGSLDQFNELNKVKKNNNTILKYECTVGAALPIISTLNSLIDTGDTILEITGCFSGTLSFIFSELDKGKKFSEIVQKAKERGYTEPDPRDDLSGLDVARKSLILSRIIGLKSELEDIKIESLFPKELEHISVEDFMEKIKKIDKTINEKIINAKKNKNVLRYVANIKDETIEIGIKEFQSNSAVGSLGGPDNVCVIKTKRYNKNPIVIRGPGAGIEVTAAGVFNDILEISRLVGG